MTLPLRAALLDLDGTLVDSIPDLAHAANAMRVDMGLAPLAKARVATFVGKGVDSLVRRSLTDSLIDAELDAETFARARTLFFHHYHLVNGEQTGVFDGVIAGLNHMRSQDLKLAIVTNKPSAFTTPLLHRTGLAGFFQVLVCGDTCTRRKPDPAPILLACQLLGVAPASSVTIGDSLNDTQAGRAAGTHVLAVPYGYNEGQDVRNLDADAIVDSLVEAARWIQARNKSPIFNGATVNLSNQ